MNDNLVQAINDPKVTIPVKTVQLAQWRRLKPLDGLVDITVKSGLVCLAPTWDMLNSLRAGQMTEEQYREHYTNLTVARIRSNPHYYRELFIELLVGRRAIVFACYCRFGKFCHRNVLIEDVLPQVAELLKIDFEYQGEVT